MKTLQELEKFYENELLDDLKELEQQRLAIMKKVMALGLIVGGAVVGVLLLMYPVIEQDFEIALYPLFGGVAIVGFALTYLSRSYVSGFKEQVIEAIVHFIDKNLDYRSTECISQETYLNSEIFPRRPDRYVGDDFVSGRIDKTEIRFCELHSEYKTHSHSGKGRRQTQWHTIFKGLFFVGDFNKHFSGTTVVLPDMAERLFGRFGKTLQKWNKGRGELIKLEDPEFEKEFVVYGDDQVEARYLLSTSLMNRIVDFKRKTGRRIHLSFVHSMVFVAISYSKSLFEPRLFKTLLDFAPVQEYFEDLQLVIGIVEDLNLNTRIWTKE